jgi:hypothetical protein
MLLQQGQGSPTAMIRDFIIRNDRHINQGKGAVIEVFRQSRGIEFIKPAR